MATALQSLPEALRLDADGVIRIGPSRVTLETLFAAFTSGATPEQIVIDFPTLDLADVYSAIGYLLRNRTAVDEYLATAATQADALRASHSNLYVTDIRQKLLARRQSAKAS
jgi:uncharacterized protein (DUF433 family)